MYDGITGCALSDTVLTETSTLGVEASFAGKETMFLILPGHNYDIEAIQSGQIETGFSPQEIVDFVGRSQALERPPLRSNIEVFINSITASP